MLRALILDENALIRELLSEWLAEAGYRVGAAAHVGALPPALTEEVDVVLVDLPVLREGAQAVIAPVRRACARARLVGLSSRLGASLPQRSGAARALGLDGLLAKTCTREELLGLLARLGLAP
ncbi:MAG: hypothetical protein JO224_04730 [Pelomonas sp.]|nr:hypothetical protein [Roseateles sp.]